MLESDYILMQRIINVRTAYNILSDCLVEKGTNLQEVLLLLSYEKDNLSLQLGDLEIKDNN